MDSTVTLSLKSLATALGGEARADQVLCPGPGHSAKDRSLCVKLDGAAADGFVVHSFAGDDPIVCRDFVRAKTGTPEFKPNGHRRRAVSENDIERAVMAAAASQSSKPTGGIVATYDYVDADGNLLYQLCRYQPKNFRQRRPDGNDGWTWSLGERRIPYRLPELLKYPGGTVFVCEGEKDADRVAALGHCATAVAAGKWTDECVTALTGRDILILQDHDLAGRKKAREAARLLHPVAKSVAIVALPDLRDGGDVSDWLDVDPHRKDRFVDICMGAPAWMPDAKTEAASEHTSPAEPRATLRWLDMSNWDDEPIPEREWAIPDLVPLRQIGLFSGEGGAGKSIIELQKNIAHVLGRDWLAFMPEPRPAIYIGAEDDEQELHIRLAAIANHYGTTFTELIKRGLHVLPLLGEDATLCAVSGKSGRVETTKLYDQLYEAAGDIKPINLSIDTLSRAFAGNEIDRVQVYAFAMLMQKIAMVAGGSVTILSHPSLAGISSGTGISGSTAWHGAFRFRQYLKSTKATDGEQPDNDLRELEFKKNQYGPLSESIVLRYQHGLFLPEGGGSPLDKLAREARVDEIFLDLLTRFSTQGRNVSEKPNAPTYAPTTFAHEAEAKKDNVRKAELETAMRRLFAADKIHVETYGRPSRPYSRLAVGQAQNE